VFRLSGTGSSGATIRIYLEKFSEDVTMRAEDALETIAEKALSASQIKQLTGRENPSVIT
jgi:phosphoglucomutase